MGRMLARHCLRAARNRQKLRPMAVFRQPFRRTGQQFLYPSRTLHRPENPLRRRRSSEILAQTRTAKPTAARLGVRTSRPVRPLADFRRTPAPRRRAYRRATAAPDYHPSYHRPTQPPNRHRTRNRKNRRPVAIRKNRLTNRPQSPSLKRRQPTHRPSFRYPPLPAAHHPRRHRHRPENLAATTTNLRCATRFYRRICTRLDNGIMADKTGCCFSGRLKRSGCFKLFRRPQQVNPSHPDPHQ